VTGPIPLVRMTAALYGGNASRDGPKPLAPRRIHPKGHPMTTAHIHAELIAAFLGDDEPCYGECQCVPCRASRPEVSGVRIHGRPGNSARR
jgi:hypothetical protein